MRSLARIANYLANALANAKFEDADHARVAEEALAEFDQHDGVLKAFEAVKMLVDEAQAAQLHRNPSQRGAMYEAIHQQEQLIKEVLRAYREGS